MKRKVVGLICILLLVALCLPMISACNAKARKGRLDLSDGSRPDEPSLISSSVFRTVSAAMAEGADEDTKKLAAMALYDVANASRINTPLSLMIQNSDAGIPPALGQVIMRGFNLKAGDEWYYQLVADVTAQNKAIAAIMKIFAGLLKVAYTAGDGVFNYAIIKGDASEADCSLDNFPYASFRLTEKPRVMDETAFKEELHYLASMHELNNMAFSKDIIADGVSIEYNSEKRFYTVKFEVDMSSDRESLERWYALAQKDMQVSGNSIERYNYYKVTLEVWDNGYAKYLLTESDRTATGLASGAPVDEFKYFWKENEIMALLKQDESVENAQLLKSPSDYVAYYSDSDAVRARLGKAMIAIICTGSIIGFSVFAFVAAKVTVEILVRKGKLPKLAAKRATKKAKREGKRNAKTKCAYDVAQAAIDAVSVGEDANGDCDEQDANAGENAETGTEEHI